MASSIIGGLLSKGVSAAQITAADPYAPSREKLKTNFEIHTTDDNIAALETADVIILAVKPQTLKSVCEDLAPALVGNPLIVSIAAGITIDSLEQWLGSNYSIVRCMPNTPALVQCGATGLFANQHCSESQKHLAEDILLAVGIIEWLDQETQIDTVTAVSGSGPAYYFLFMEAMIEAAVDMGLERDTATRLTLQTALGAAELAQQDNASVAELRQRVTSPKGTTEKAVLSFETDGIRQLVARAMQACEDRSIELSQELDNN